MRPSSLDGVGVGASLRVHEVRRVINVEVDVSQGGQVDVSFPLVSYHRGAPPHVCRHDVGESRGVTLVSRTDGEEAGVRMSLYSSDHPSAVHESSSVKFSFSELCLVNFNDG